jgi:hypothetical protein
MANLLPIVALAAGAFILLGRGKAVNKESDAILTAIGDLGLNANAVTLTDHAFFITYPDAPKKLNPEDPTHQEPIENWLRIFTEVKARKQAARPTTGAPDTDAGPGELSQEVDAWIDSLNASQKTAIEGVVGDSLYASMKAAAESGDDSRTQAQLDRLSLLVGSMGIGDKISAGSTLKSALTDAQIAKARSWMGM